ncbi:hypothetical protein KVR01_009127 [Diaporthe batatas]|uniref:uncharacterized protein n=1 Tax=Diaporthe batatas TaxID=748121 RepID=UPI001D053C50|nr:uncharacterized protein KVR01_009127 [Diaporthe batatas]KAG8160863.1 hypothetical protein KVR01_009127 [Diaporthe batatas]
MASIYAPLHSDGRKFRLLVLEPSPDRQAPIRCQLKQSSFDNAIPEYKALSYTWGDPLVTTPISVNDAEIQITVNLEAALRHIRNASDAITIWVDALCINQTDVAEKNHQVEMMRDIYSGAELVIAWLGSASEDSDLAMEILSTGLDAWMESEGSQRSSTQEDELQYQSSTSSESVLNNEWSVPAPVGEEGLAPAPAWVTASELGQEMMDLQLPNSAPETVPGATSAFSGDLYGHQAQSVILGHPSISPFGPSSSSSDDDSEDEMLEFVDRKLERLPQWEARSVIRLLARSWWSRIWVVQEVLLAKKFVLRCGDAEVPGEIMRGDVARLLLVARVDRVDIPRYSAGVILLDHIGTWKEKHYTLDELLFRYRARKATRPHDHIYGLLGIIPNEDRDLIGAPDYECRVEDLFIGIAKKLMLRDNSVALLVEAADTSPASPSSTITGLPSWVPDWTRPRFSRNVSAVDLRNPFSEAEYYFSEDCKRLMLKCFKIGKIESVKPVPALLAQGQMPMWQNSPETTDKRSPPLQGIIIALLISCWMPGLERLDNEEGFQFVAAFLQELEEYCIYLGRSEAAEVYNKGDYLAGFLEWTNDSRDGRIDEKILEKRWYQGMSSVWFPLVVNFLCSEKHSLPHIY